VRIKITIEQISKGQNEEVILRCHEVNDQILQMLQSPKAGWWA